MPVLLVVSNPLSLNTDGMCSVCVHGWLIGADDKIGVLRFLCLVFSLSP